MGLYSLFVIYFWGGTGMWDESMQTLALMGLAVLLCVCFGVTLGVLCSQSDRFDNFMKPIQMAGPWITELEKRTDADMMENGWDN